MYTFPSFVLCTWNQKIIWHAAVCLMIPFCTNGYIGPSCVSHGTVMNSLVELPLARWSFSQQNAIQELLSEVKCFQADSFLAWFSNTFNKREVALSHFE